MATSPLQPFLVTVARCSQQLPNTCETDGQIDDLDDIDLDEGSDIREGQFGASPQVAQEVQLSFESEAGAVNAEQLNDIIEV